MPGRWVRFGLFVTGMHVQIALWSVQFTLLSHSEIVCTVPYVTPCLDTAILSNIEWPSTLTSLCLCVHSTSACVSPFSSQRSSPWVSFRKLRYGPHKGGTLVLLEVRSHTDRVVLKSPMTDHPCGASLHRLVIKGQKFP